MSEETKELQKCSKCGSLKFKSLFKISETNGKLYKTCIKCREKVNNNKCEHNRRKQTCKDCGGSSICEHNRRKATCKDCGGSSRCEHNRQKSQCKDCGGSSICEHNRRKQTCKDCGGSSICEHNRRKAECIKCSPKRACQYCFQIYVNPRYRFKPYCFRCYCVLNPDVDIPRKYMIKEHHMRDALKEEFKNTELVFNKIIEGGCSLKRPDVRIECLTHSIVIECDENQHKYTSCEEKRMMILFEDLGNRPLVMIRFNPDKYNKNEGCFKDTKTGSLSLNKKEWNSRIKKLIEIIKENIKKIPDKEISIEYMFYND